MAFKLKEMSGSLFKNNKKEKENHPNMTGSAKIDGVEYWVSGWTKGEGEKRWISLAFKPKENQDHDSNAPSRKEPKTWDDDDGVPF